MGSLSDEFGHQQPGGRSRPRQNSEAAEHPWAPEVAGDGNSTCNTRVLYPVGGFLTVLGVYIAFFSSTLLSTLAYLLLLALLVLAIGRRYSASAGSVRLPRSIEAYVDTGTGARRGRRPRRQTTPLSGRRGRTRSSLASPSSLFRKVWGTLGARIPRPRNKGSERL